LATDERLNPVPVEVAFTDTDGTIAPVESVTVPLILLLLSWAAAGRKQAMARSATAIRA